MTAHPLRLPVLFLFAASLVWLVFAAACHALAGAELVFPQLSGDSGALTFGRLRPAAENALLYGFLSQAGMGAGLWLLARLGRRAEKIWFLAATTAFWNLAVLAGVSSIFFGQSTGVPGLEFPPSVSVLMLLSFLGFGLAILDEILRRDTPLYLSESLVAGAALCFPWLYGTANALLIWFPVSGAAQTPLVGWFQTGLLWLWLVPLALASAAYILPVAAARSFRAPAAATAALWTLFLFGGWTGGSHQAGGPVPVWIVTAGIAAALLLPIPAILFADNFLRLPTSPDTATIRLGLLGLALAVIAQALGPFCSSLLRFTDCQLAAETLNLGSLTLIFLGSLRWILPRLSLRPSPRWPVTLAVGALGLTILAYAIGGLIQGLALAQPDLPFMVSLDRARPFRAVAALGRLMFLLAVARCAWDFARTSLPTAQPAPQETRA